MKPKTPEKLWDYIERTALSLDILPNTIAQWRCRGFVPRLRHYSIVTQSKKLNIPISHKELYRQWEIARTIK